MLKYCVIAFKCTWLPRKFMSRALLKVYSVELLLHAIIVPSCKIPYFHSARLDKKNLLTHVMI